MGWTCIEKSKLITMGSVGIERSRGKSFGKTGNELRKYG